MSYVFEALGDERFQQLAHSILISEFPDVQCMPVGQPDGGRDAFQVPRRGLRKDLVVFQIKFSRNPALRTERDAIDALVASDAAKVAKLKERGLVSYYLITNVAGTSHPDVGSIDTVNDTLSKMLGVHSFCWWRDDLVARINAHSDIKWSFPDILRGSDVLQMLVEGKWREREQQRQFAIRSYIANQHALDEEIRFKQVDLRGDIIDLFVDLPISPMEDNMVLIRSRKSKYKFVQGRNMRVRYGMARDFGHRVLANASDILLSTEPEIAGLSRIILQGAPGQGKSTITQYVSQINRLKILSKQDDLDRVTIAHRQAPISIPFRVDLRDFASWVAGRNIFSADRNSDVTPNPSLENFLAAQVSYHSGGQEFSTSDLIAVFRAGKSLVVLDGFDEVADIAIRRRVVEEIEKAAHRVESHTKEVQIVVTSRPAAFANAPGFSASNWLHLELQSLTSDQSNTYTQKWMEAKNLPLADRKALKQLLDEKLAQPHMRDLARNPMQLTILLALVLVRGMSLPDKRTALYDSYMELFFNRESEKSLIVRDHRDLLIDIHRYLAWHLHAAAESEAGSGRIGLGDLKDLLTQYLKSEGRDIGLVEEFFTGVTQRVMALVSRVQDTYEFEVQPLREYFAARYLYETAPYSPVGVEKKGTKPDIFAAISKNFYWLNVCRFFCGCYSKGELSSLADGLEELSKMSGYRLLSHPTSLAFILLRDWVFAQQAQVTTRVVSVMVSAKNLRLYRATVKDSLAFPDNCGRELIVSKIFTLIQGECRRDILEPLYEIVNDNTSKTERLARWCSQKATLSVDKWIALGVGFNLLGEIKPAERKSLWASHPADTVRAYIKTGQLTIEEATNFRSLLFTEVMDRRNVLISTQDTTNGILLGLERITFALSSLILNDILGDKSETPASIHVHAYGVRLVRHEDDTKVDAGIARVEKAIEEEYQKSCASLSSSKKAWVRIFDKATKEIGNFFVFQRMALIVSAAKSLQDEGVWSSPWSDQRKFLDRMLFSRKQRNALAWWRARILELENAGERDRIIAVAALLVHGNYRVITAMADQLSLILDAFDADSWAMLSGLLLDLSYVPSRGNWATAAPPSNTAAPRLQAALAVRGGPNFGLSILNANRSFRESSDPFVSSLCIDLALRRASNDISLWHSALNILKTNGTDVIPPFGRSLEPSSMPYEIAESICNDALDLPLYLVEIAQKRVVMTVGSSATKLSDVANLEGWFVN